MKFLFLIITIFMTVPTYSQDLVQPTCVSLEKSGFLSSYNLSDVAISHDQQLIARYEEINSRTEGLFRLWNAKTGKLLQSKKLSKRGETGSRSSLHFSPSSGLVYLTNLMIKVNTKITGQSTLAFWNLSSNKVVPSACESCNEMSNHITEIRLNSEETVASLTNHHGHSLCSTTQEKLLACGDSASFDPKNKGIFEAISKRPVLQQRESISQGSTALELSKDSKVTKYSIPGGYADDQQYRKHGAYKFDEFFLFRSKNIFRNESNNKLFILNWKNGTGGLVKADGGLTVDFSPYWMPKQKQLIIGFTDYGGNPIDSLSAYHVEQKTLKRISGNDEVLHVKRAQNSMGKQGVNYVVFTEWKKQMLYCQLWRGAL